MAIATKALDGGGNLTFDAEAEGLTTQVALLAVTISIKDGQVLVDLACDYHVCVRERRDGTKQLWLVNRQLEDREKFPNWPKPEPLQV